MTETQRSQCHTIIHTAAATAGASNLIPVPGAGVAADILVMTGMAMSLAAVFGGSITNEVAKAMAISAIKETALKQPIKVLTKELSKFIPFLGQLVAPAITITMIESAGWIIANDLDKQQLLNK